MHCLHSYVTRNGTQPRDRTSGQFGEKRGTPSDISLSPDEPVAMKHCHRCDRTLAATAFGRNSGKPDGLQSQCRECRVGTNATYAANTPERNPQRRAGSEARRQEWGAFRDNYFETHPCIDCGESTKAALQFDHVRGKKEFNIGNGGHLSLDKLKAEVMKCEVRCANCHAIVTEERMGTGYRLFIHEYGWDAWEDTRPPAKRLMTASAMRTGCVDCGTKDIRVLEFDHVRGEKSFSLSKPKLRSLAEIETEIAKCEVRCRNHHRVVTSERRSGFKSQGVHRVSSTSLREAERRVADQPESGRR